MKKIIMLFLTVAIATSLCACGSKSGSGTGNKLVLGEPSQEELDMINEYTSILYELDSYAESGEIVFTEYDEETEIETQWKGNLALGRYYTQLKELGDIDKWIGTEYCDETRTRQEVLDSFKVVKDVKLYKREYTYNRINELVYKPDDIIWCDWHYDENGTIVCETEGYLRNAFEDLLTNVMEAKAVARRMVCDDNGDVTKIEYFALSAKYYKDVAIKNGKQSVDWVSVPTFDYDGNLISESVTTSSSDINIVYTYDDDGRMTKMEVHYKYLQQDSNHDEKTITFTYVYDKQGNLMQETGSYVNEGGSSVDKNYSKEYSYGQNGHVESCIYSYHNNNSTYGDFERNITYTTDEKGRIIEEQYVNGDDLNVHKTTYTYGDYYIYEPSK